MPSAPPPQSFQSQRPDALATLERAAFDEHVAREGVLFFCVENAPREACETRKTADGTLTFHVVIVGRVVAAPRGSLVIGTDAGTEVIVRYLVPTGVELGALEGHRVEIELEQRYRGRGRATIDAEIRDEFGRLILWAHDGRMPEDRDARGLTLRTSLDATGMRLAIRAAELVSLSCPGAVELTLGSRDFTLALARLGADDVGFVMMRR